MAFGKNLLEFQNTRFKLAECKTEAHIGRVFLDNCIERLMRGLANDVTSDGITANAILPGLTNTLEPLGESDRAGGHRSQNCRVGASGCQ